jgi:hypothetical protein
MEAIMSEPIKTTPQTGPIPGLNIPAAFLAPKFNAVVRDEMLAKLSEAKSIIFRLSASLAQQETKGIKKAAEEASEVFSYLSTLIAIYGVNVKTLKGEAVDQVKEVCDVEGKKMLTALSNVAEPVATSLFKILDAFALAVQKSPVEPVDTGMNPEDFVQGTF